MCSNRQISSSPERPPLERLAARGLLLLISLYQRLLSPFLGGQCRFHPSCSQYARHALERRRLLPALGLIARRLARCHPFHPGGYDPLDPEEAGTVPAVSLCPPSGDR